jgi:hypothetical protein
MTQLSDVRLGKRRHKHDDRTLRLARYVEAADLPEAPPSFRYSTPVASWPMYANDRLGDCTCAAAGHMIQAWTANAAEEVTIPEKAVVDAYDQVNGGVDEGAVELDVLNFWRKKGVGGHKIGAFAAIDLQSAPQIKDAVWLFGGVYIGVALPAVAQQQGNYWHMTHYGIAGPGAVGSWGGHAVPVVDYNRYGLTVVTWGELTRMSWGFWNTYCDEAWAIISPDFLDPATGKAPPGFDLAQLNKDLNALAQH